MQEHELDEAILTEAIEALGQDGMLGIGERTTDALREDAPVGRDPSLVLAL